MTRRSVPNDAEKVTPSCCPAVIDSACFGGRHFAALNILINRDTGNNYQDGQLCKYAFHNEKDEHGRAILQPFFYQIKYCPRTIKVTLCSILRSILVDYAFIEGCLLSCSLGSLYTSWGLLVHVKVILETTSGAEKGYKFGEQFHFEQIHTPSE